MEPRFDGGFRRRNLPHWDIADGTYFVTTCLAGSISAAALREIEAYRHDLVTQKIPEGLTEAAWKARQQKLVFVRLDGILDHRPGRRHLHRIDLAIIVQNALNFFEGVRYRTASYVVMPSHIHWVFSPKSEWVEGLPPGRTPREIIMHSFKSYTSNQCNAVLGQSGPFWQDESFDHWIRNDDELGRVNDYVENNPVKAGLTATPDQYRFSSAYKRRHG